MNRSSLLTLIFVTIVAIFVILAYSILHDGLSARATPTNLEAAIARRVRHLAIPSWARRTPNPLSATPENLREARLHFADHCSICHANDGSGSSMIGEGLYPKPPDLRLARTQQLSDGELFWIIENGVRFTGMPAFSGHGMGDDSWKLVLFIRHLPQLTPEERIEMERYNPKNPDEREEEKEEDEFLNGNAPEKKTAPAKQEKR